MLLPVDFFFQNCFSYSRSDHLIFMGWGWGEDYFVPGFFFAHRSLAFYFLRWMVQDFCLARIMRIKTNNKKVYFINYFIKR